MSTGSTETRDFHTFEEVLDAELTEPVWYVGSAEGLVAPYEGTREDATKIALEMGDIFEETAAQVATEKVAASQP